MDPKNLKIILDFYNREALGQTVSAASASQGEFISIDNDAVNAALAALSSMTLEPPTAEPGETVSEVDAVQQQEAAAEDDVEPEALEHPSAVPVETPVVHRSIPRPRPVRRTTSGAAATPPSDDPPSSEHVAPARRTRSGAPSKSARSSGRGH